VADRILNDQLWVLLRQFFPEKTAIRVATGATTVFFSKRSSGSPARVRPGATCRPNSASGIQPIRDIIGGKRRASGPASSRRCASRGPTACAMTKKACVGSPARPQRRLRRQMRPRKSPPEAKVPSWLISQRPALRDVRRSPRPAGPSIGTGFGSGRARPGP
jgi:hypothetical protein